MKNKNNTFFWPESHSKELTDLVGFVTILLTLCSQEHMKKIDPDDYLCLGAHSIQGVQTGVVVWSPGLISSLIHITINFYSVVL